MRILKRIAVEFSEKKFLKDSLRLGRNSVVYFWTWSVDKYSEAILITVFPRLLRPKTPATAMDAFPSKSLTPRPTFPCRGL